MARYILQQLLDDIKDITQPNKKGKPQLLKYEEYNDASYQPRSPKETSD